VDRSQATDDCRSLATARTMRSVSGTGMVFAECMSRRRAIID
jgi:hypothetical protein